MHSQFEEINAYVYYSAQGVLLDALIWCLGPYVDDSRGYGSARILLAHATCRLVRRFYRIQG